MAGNADQKGSPKHNFMRMKELGAMDAPSSYLRGETGQRPRKYKPKANGTTSGGWFEKQNILKCIMSDSIYVEFKYM